MPTRGAFIILTLLLIGIPSTFVFAQPTYPAINAGVSNTIPLTTPTPSPTPEETNPGGPPLRLTLSLLCFCFVFSLVIGVFVLGVIVRTPGRKDKKEEHGL